MRISSGKVVGGRVELDGELPEGASVTVLATEGDETFEAAWQSGWTMPIDLVMDQIASQPRLITPRVTAAQ